MNVNTHSAAMPWTPAEWYPRDDAFERATTSPAQPRRRTTTREAAPCRAPLHRYETFFSGCARAHTAAEDLLELIMRRCERGSALLT